MWGFVIPGLTMNISEIPCNQGLYRLQNPGFKESNGSQGTDLEEFRKGYSLDEVAQFHLHTISDQLKNNPNSENNKITFIGMSMGGMILSILASKYRHRLPENSKFLFLVTSANTKSLPVVPSDLFKRWVKVKPGSVESIKSTIIPFFSKEYVDSYGQVIHEYSEYRAFGRNGQSASAFTKQLNALMSFEGERSFANCDPKESIFLSGAHDYILGPQHSRVLRELNPRAKHIEIEKMGHMINFERPEFFSKEVIDSL